MRSEWPKDSRSGIMRSLGHMTEIMSRGGGVGMNLSSLRARYAYVKGVNGRSSGAVSWGGLFSFVTGLIEQGGSRRGALMLILDVWHPDIMDFINVKRDLSKIVNANISVGITDDFMDAVKNDKEWTTVFPDTSDPEYNEKWDGDLKAWKEMGKKIIPVRTYRARDVWNAIIESAWACAEPGVFFVDRYNKMPFIALAPSPDHRKAKILRGENCPYIDYMFYWMGDPSVFFAMTKLIEDSINVEHDTNEADVQVIIFVEDSVRFISTYLPHMYTLLIEQNRASSSGCRTGWTGPPAVLLSLPGRTRP